MAYQQSRTFKYESKKFIFFNAKQLVFNFLTCDVYVQCVQLKCNWLEFCHALYQACHQEVIPLHIIAL